MDESTEELKANMEKVFAQRVEADQKLTALADHLNSGKGTYVTAEQYAYQTGKVLSGVFREQITEEKLPEGVFTKEFVQGTIEPLLKDDHKIVSTMAAVAQENINTAAGVHIRPQKADFNQDRAEGFATKMDGKTMEEAGWMLGSPVTSFSQSVVSDTMIKNGEVLAKAGKAAMIKRDAEGGCCDWCSGKAGTYDATNREAYQRHRECRCEIEMHIDGSIKRQTDWKHNQWQEVKNKVADNIAANQQNGSEEKKNYIDYLKENDTINYKIVTNRKEAYASLREMFGSINKNVSVIDEGLLCDNVTRLNELNARFGVLKKGNAGEFTTSPSEEAIAWTRGAFERNGNCTDLSLVGRAYKDAAAFERKSIAARSSFHHMPFSDEYTRVYTVTHEYGHMIEKYVCCRRADWDVIEKQISEALGKEGRMADKLEEVKKIRKGEETRIAGEIHDEIISIAKRNNPNFNEADHRSNYGYVNNFEFFAEAFANSQCGDPNELGTAMNEWLQKEGFR